MILEKIMKALKKDASYDSRINDWLQKQSHVEDALIYLIEKELYEYGERDMSYVIPRIRNDAYFEALLKRESFDSRFHSNIDMYDSIAHIHKEEHTIVTEPMPQKVTPVAPKPAAQPHVSNEAAIVNPEPIDLGHKKHSPSYVHKGGSISSINKRRDIYNTSSSVVFTAPDEQYNDSDVDVSCFED